MTVASIHQPQYLPYLGFFHKLAQSEIFVLMDQAQFQRRGVQHRNRIKTPDGWGWLTVPIRKPTGRDPVTGRSEQRSCDVRIDGDDDWQRRHWNAVRLNYAGAPYFDDYARAIQDLLERPWRRLLDLDMETMEWLRSALGIVTPIVRESELDVEGTGSHRLASICRAVGADVYLSGPGGRQYMDLDVFDVAGVEVKWQEFRTPPYDQVFPATGFVPDLSALDALLCCGPGAPALIGR